VAGGASGTFGRRETFADMAATVARHLAVEATGYGTALPV